MLVDEYGTVSGMITVATVIEELVGRIGDEFDVDVPMIVKRGSSYEVDALWPISEAIDSLGLTIDATDVDTLGGLVTALLGHIPVSGEEVDVSNCVITVLEAESRRAIRLLVTPRPADSDAAAATGEAGERDGTGETTA